METDALVAAPNSHKLIFENDSVRILEVSLDPGQKEPMHEHRNPSVMIVNSSAALRYHSSEGKLNIPRRNVSFEKPYVEWLDKEGMHAVENLGKTQYHAWRIEIKSDK